MDEREFLSALRSRENFKKAVVNKIVLDRRTRRADFILMTDQPFAPQDEEFIRDLVQKAVPPSLKAGFEIRKLVCDEQLVRQRILEYLKATHLAAAAFIKGEDISVRTGEPTVFVFGVDEAEKKFLRAVSRRTGTERKARRGYRDRRGGRTRPLSGDAHRRDRRFRGHRFCRSSSNGYLCEGLVVGGG